MAESSADTVHFLGFLCLDIVPGRVGIPVSRLSGYEKWEAPDPAEWCPRGYAIVNPDSRGTWDCEGNCGYLDKNEAEDGYDVIEFLAEQSWCNGSEWRCSLACSLMD